MTALGNEEDTRSRTDLVCFAQRQKLRALRRSVRRTRGGALFLWALVFVLLAVLVLWRDQGAFVFG